MTIQQKMQSMIEEAFGDNYWQQTLSKIHDKESDITRYDAFYKHNLNDAISLEMDVQYSIDDHGKERFEVDVLKQGKQIQLSETKVFTGKYAFKHAKEYVNKLD